MPAYLKPVSQRGAVTRWVVESPGSRMTARITRTIDIDGDEEWRVEVKRGETWSPMPTLSGRNKPAADRIRREFDCVFFEVEELEQAARDAGPRRALHVGGTIARIDDEDARFEAGAAMAMREGLR